MVYYNMLMHEQIMPHNLHSLPQTMLADSGGQSMLHITSIIWHIFVIVYCIIMLLRYRTTSFASSVYFLFTLVFVLVYHIYHFYSIDIISGILSFLITTSLFLCLRAWAKVIRNYEIVLRPRQGECTALRKFLCP